MGKDTEAKCLCCGEEIESFPDQDGSCDYRCFLCGWSEHVPSRGKDHGLSADSSLRTVALARVDPALLEGQAAILGNIIERRPLSVAERSCLEGLWELAHALLDSMESETPPAGKRRRRDSGQ